jgi:hypothetical protein
VVLLLLLLLLLPLHPNFPITRSKLAVGIPNCLEPRPYPLTTTDVIRKGNTMDGSICLSEDEIFDDESAMVVGMPLSDSVGRDVMAGEIGWQLLGEVANKYIHRITEP